MARSTKTGPKADTQPDTKTPETGQPDITQLLLLNDSEGKHTAVALAAEFGVDESTIRRRWHKRTADMVGELRIKVAGKYTDLAKGLFQDYCTRVHRGDMHPDAWSCEVVDIAVKLIPPDERTFSAKADVVPDKVETALARNTQTMGQLDDYMARMSDRNAALGTFLADTIEGFEESGQAQFEQELQAAIMEGQQRGAMIYAARRRAQNDTMQQLDQRALDAKRRLGE